jgi:N-acetylglucosaminylphosphatidylinositol deacetylase
VIAHPDDEAMFFVPTVSSFVAAGADCFLLCLSSGNYDGLGATRRTELVASAQVLGIPATHVQTIDDPLLQDGPKESWPAREIGGVLDTFVKRHRIDTLVTFDAQGVSGHPNHISVHVGVRDFIQQSTSTVRAYQLESTNILRKYLGIVDFIWSQLLTTFSRDGRLLLCSPNPLLSYWAMCAHASQFVWYRYLFVIFSRYTFMNTVVPLESPAKSE